MKDGNKVKCFVCSYASSAARNSRAKNRNPAPNLTFQSMVLSHLVLQMRKQRANKIGVLIGDMAALAMQGKGCEPTSGSRQDIKSGPNTSPLSSVAILRAEAEGPG